MGDENQLSTPVRRLVNLLVEYSDGLTLEQLTQQARVRFRGLAAARVHALIRDAMAAGAVTERSGRLLAAVRPPTATEDAAERSAHQSAPLRAVVIDLESVVRTTAIEPYTDKRVYQIGAVRVGADAEWIATAPTFTCWVQLPDDEWLIASEKVRSTHAAAAVPPVDALSALLEYTAGADVVVAYNGVEADFPLLNQACDREGLPHLSGEYVDAYYLALALWPIAPSYRLAHLAEHLGVVTDDLAWHDATADAVLLARLLHRAAREVAGWPAPLRDLVASVCPDSPGWRLVRELAGDGVALGEARPHGHADVAAVAQARLAVRRPRRSAVATRPPVRVDDALRGGDGRVDPVELAAVAHGAAATRRPAQEEMTAALHRWADAGTAGLVEAPTGTGKSFAILAAALDWLHDGLDRTAIIATFTKQLQAQLAFDVATLDVAVPGLLDASDVVKGAVNRLSLRALLVTMADATTLDTSRTARPGASSRFLERLGFRELLVFLLLRLLAAEGAVHEWAARSVDPVDLPAFFADYAGPALPVWLESLSQASSGEYNATSPQPIAAHTDFVNEALANHRLILANHALLLAHMPEMAGLGAETLLIVDEAHQLEDAVTSALTATLDYRAVEDLFSDLEGWVTEHRGRAGADAVADAVRNLGFLLDHEQLPKVAGMAFDARSAGVGVSIGARSVTLTSPYSGTAGVGQVRMLAGLLTRLAGQCRAIVGALAAYQTTHGGTMDFFAAERMHLLIARTAAVDATATTIVDDVEALLGPPLRRKAAASAESTGDEQPATDDEAEDDESLGDEDDDEGKEDVDGWEDESPIEMSGAVTATVLPNRVVYAEETEALRAGLRSYRFRIASAPIELPADPTWQQFLGAFTRIYYVSATLRVAGEWTFLRARLGLPDAMPAIALDTPFNMAEQAELVCFSDFPSWAEQADGAMRTVAHQLAGYASAMIRPAWPSGDALVATERGGFDGGAMLLTTARSTAGGTADYLATELRRRGDETPVHSALVVGNARAVRQFTDREFGGGIMVGTKGLWQGVDVADPDRLRLVWINKLPFAPFAAPIIEARRAAVALRAEQSNVEDPDAVATQTYYLPLAALQLRQAVGRLIRSERHRGVIVISDRKLAGTTALRRSYRQTFLGSLDRGLLRPDPDTGEPAGGNVVPMAEGWKRIWSFFVRQGLLDPEVAARLSTPDALEEHTLLPQTRRIRELALTPQQVAELDKRGELADEVVRRAAEIGGLLNLSDAPAELKGSQVEVIRAVAQRRNVLGLLPTGFGKSFCFQLPALVLPGVTIVVSPLVALMHDQALELNRSIGGAVRALVAPLRESSSRAGKTETADQLLGRAEHGIRLIYVSPERLCQRRFRELVRTAVADGRVSRIALDEAHTFVQWGDDFRPSFRRVEQLLAELRAEFGLPVTALTATANQAVHAGLREGVFGLPADPPSDGDGNALATVAENPIRPELAIFRRSIANAGPSIVAGLAEEVLEAVDDHAIFYCLTVKEVVALHAHLREYLGEAGVRVRRFHGRLTEAEKSAVMNEFREAPRKGEEGFAPLVVVATSAFGLGINRPDIRTVFCVSPPTDLAALYQQLGRAGRDAAGRVLTTATGQAVEGAANATGNTPSAPADSGRPANVGLTLLTTRGLRTVAFLTGQDLPPQLLNRMGRAVLACRDVLDSADVADRLIGEDLTAGRLTPHEARKLQTVDSYIAGVVRAFAALAALGVVDDLGDFPPTVAVKPGELLGRVSAAGDYPGDEGTALVKQVESEAVAAVLELPSRPVGLQRLGRARLDVVAVDRHLSTVVARYRQVVPDAPSTWQLLADLHDRGQLDVSAAPSRRLVTGVSVRAVALPNGFRAALSGKAARAAREIALLRDFFNDRSTCANRKFAEYFGVTNLPDGCCVDAATRCSACWDFRTDWAEGETPPATAQALLVDRPRPAGWRVDAAARARRLDEQVRLLVWHVSRGLTAPDVYRALRGEDSWYLARARRRIRLPTVLVTSRLFGANPSVKLADVDDSLARLAADRRIVLEGRRWRDVDNIAREQRRLARRTEVA